MRDNHGNRCSGNDSRDSALNVSDAELTQCLAQTLQNSTDALDGDTRARLAAMRHQALARSSVRRIASAFAVAASVLVLVAMPWMLRQQTHENKTDDVAYLSVDPEMLTDMDMLMAIGEVQ